MGESNDLCGQYSDEVGMSNKVAIVLCREWDECDWDFYWYDRADISDEELYMERDRGEWIEAFVTPEMHQQLKEWDGIVHERQKALGKLAKATFPPR